MIQIWIKTKNIFDSVLENTSCIKSIFFKWDIWQNLENTYKKLKKKSLIVFTGETLER